MNKSIASIRQMYRYQLAMMWLRHHRPDVWDAISAEVDKKHPNPKPITQKELPNSLAKLK